MRVDAIPSATAGIGVMAFDRRRLTEKSARFVTLMLDDRQRSAVEHNPMDPLPAQVHEAPAQGSGCLMIKA